MGETLAGFTWQDCIDDVVGRLGTLTAVAERLAAANGFAEDVGSVERALRRLRARGLQARRQVGRAVGVALRAPRERAHPTALDGVVSLGVHRFAGARVRGSRAAVGPSPDHLAAREPSVVDPRARVDRAPPERPRGGLRTARSANPRGRAPPDRRLAIEHPLMRAFVASRSDALAGSTRCLARGRAMVGCGRRRRRARLPPRAVDRSAGLRREPPAGLGQSRGGRGALSPLAGGGGPAVRAVSSGQRARLRAVEPGPRRRGPPRSPGRQRSMPGTAGTRAAPGDGPVHARADRSSRAAGARARSGDLEAPLGRDADDAPRTSAGYSNEILSPMLAFMCSSASALPRASSTGWWVWAVLRRCLKVANVSLTSPL